MSFFRILWISVLFLGIAVLTQAKNPLPYSSVVTIITAPVQVDRLFQHGSLPPGVGSGVIMDQEGHLLVPAPLVSRARWIDVILPNGEQVGARLVGVDYLSELALLKISHSPVRTMIQIAGRPFVRHKIFFLSRPRGHLLLKEAQVLETECMVNHQGWPFSDFYLTDLKISQLGSGPVFDAHGRLLGFALDLPEFKTDQGLLMAPPYLLKRAYEQLKVKGRVEWPWFGVKVLPINSGLAKILGVPTSRGVLVEKIYPGSPAARLGLIGQRSRASLGNLIYPTGGDVIIAIAGRRITRPAEVDRLIFSLDPGTRVEIQFYRRAKRWRRMMFLGRRSFVQP